MSEDLSVDATSHLRPGAGPWSWEEIMYWRRGTLLALAVLSLALVLAAPGAAEAGPQVDAAVKPSLGGKVWGWFEDWLAALRNPWAIFAESDCDQGSHIDPNGGGTCLLIGPGGATDGADSDQGSHIDPNGG
jgi:hypothetical protein